MKKWKFRKPQFQPTDIRNLDSRLLLINVYFTQLLCLLLALILILFQRDNPLIGLFMWTNGWQPLYWGVGLAAAVIAADLILTRWIPEEMSDDGGINEKLFGSLPLWQIIILCFVVSVCEEVLFRGVIQHWLGPYWTSILFALIHVRYLRHWLMTGLVFSISYALGWIYIQAGTLWAPIIAHFVIDLVMGCIIRYKKSF